MVEDRGRAVLDAARAVLLRDPDATMAMIAAEAGIGVGGLYRRYANKEDLLRQICADGLRRYIAIGEASLSEVADPWQAFAGFIREVVESGTHQLTVRLAGTFQLDAALADLQQQAIAVADRVFRLARGSGVLRTDISRTDLTLLLEQISAIELGDQARTTALRRRYLAVLLDGMRSDSATARLPGPPPQDEELAERWQPRVGR